MDAGTDNGFTFTSPNWPTSPQAAIFRISHDYPAHPASSFNYPDKPSLPPIAKFTFVKEKEYELSEVFNLKPKKAAPKSIHKYSYEVENNDLDNSIVTFVSSPDSTTTTPKNNEQGSSNNELLSAVKMNPQAANPGAGKVRSFRSGYHSSTGPTDFLKKKYNSPILNVSNYCHDDF